MHSPAHERASPCAARGFTLVEVLVAFVVLGIGLLGSFALLVDGTRGVRTALHRTIAVELAADLAERIRANRAAGVAYQCTSPCTGTETVDPQARDDLRTWLGALQTQLPAGAGSIEFVEPTAPGMTRCVITVSWVETDITEPAVLRLQVEV